MGRHHHYHKHTKEYNHRHHHHGYEKPDVTEDIEEEGVPMPPEVVSGILRLILGGEENANAEETCSSKPEECPEGYCPCDVLWEKEDKLSKAYDEIERLKAENECQAEQIAHLMEKHESDTYNELAVPPINPLIDIDKVYISDFTYANGTVGKMTVTVFKDGTKTKAYWNGEGEYNELLGIALCVMRRQNGTHMREDGHRSRFVCSSEVNKFIRFIDHNFLLEEEGKKSAIVYPDKKKRLKAERKSAKSESKRISRSDFNGKPEEWERLKNEVLDYKRENLELSTTEVARHFNLSDSTVSKWLKESGLRDDVRIEQAEQPAEDTEPNDESSASVEAESVETEETTEDNADDTAEE